MSSRYRCTACGNLTRFDVVASRRTRSFHHYNVAGDLEIEEVEVLESNLESVKCRWCGASGSAIEEIPVEDRIDGPAAGDAAPVEPGA